MTAKNNLRQWIYSLRIYGQKYLKTSEVYKWGAENFSNRAVRNVQDFCSKGELVERISKAEAVLLGFSGNEGVWKIKEI